MYDKHHFDPQICAPVLDFTIALNSNSAPSFNSKPKHTEGESALKLWQQLVRDTRLAQQRRQAA